MRLYSNSSEQQLRKLLKDAEQQIPSGDALLLLEYASHTPREHILSHLEESISRKKANYFTKLVNMRRAGFSVAVLTGKKEFYGRAFTVSKDVLIPRPETECLVEKAIQRLRDTAKQDILDLGTGSGCIAITLKLELPDAHVVASDISKKALSIAKINAKKLNANVQLIESDLLNSVPERTFDLIIANLPYLPEIQMAEPSIQKEPQTALYGGNTEGTFYYESLFASVTTFLKPGGSLIIEIDPSQKTLLTKKAQELLPEHSTEIIRDLAGSNRGLIFSFVN